MVHAFVVTLMILTYEEIKQVVNVRTITIFHNHKNYVNYVIKLILILLEMVMEDVDIKIIIK